MIFLSTVDVNKFFLISIIIFQFFGRNQFFKNNIVRVIGCFSFFDCRGSEKNTKRSIVKTTIPLFILWRYSLYIDCTILLYFYKLKLFIKYKIYITIHIIFYLFEIFRFIHSFLWKIIIFFFSFPLFLLISYLSILFYSISYLLLIQIGYLLIPLLVQSLSFLRLLSFLVQSYPSLEQVLSWSFFSFLIFLLGYLI